jgi:hypothetical protein
VDLTGYDDRAIDQKPLQEVTGILRQHMTGLHPVRNRLPEPEA